MKYVRITKNQSGVQRVSILIFHLGRTGPREAPISWSVSSLRPQGEQLTQQTCQQARLLTMVTTGAGAAYSVKVRVLIVQVSLYSWYQFDSTDLLTIYLATVDITI